jgi:hypothetical protein
VAGGGPVRRLQSGFQIPDLGQGGNTNVVVRRTPPPETPMTTPSRQKTTILKSLIRTLPIDIGPNLTFQGSRVAKRKLQNIAVAGPVSAPRLLGCRSDLNQEPFAY